MGAGIRVLAAALLLLAAATRCAAQLKTDYYAAVCPDLETIVRDAVTKKVQATPVAVGATIRLYFHDCFVEVRSLARHLLPFPRCASANPETFLNSSESIRDGWWGLTD